MADKKPAVSSEPDTSIMADARELRADCNAMTDEQREESFLHGMQLIYGADPRAKVKASGR